jgi:hypothetical protein
MASWSFTGARYASLTQERRKGKRREQDTYRFTNFLPLRDGRGAMEVNWCELTTTDSDGNICIATPLSATHHPCRQCRRDPIVQAGS